MERLQCRACQLTNDPWCKHYDIEWYEEQGWVMIDPMVNKTRRTLAMKRMGETTIEYLFINEHLDAPIIVTTPKGSHVRF